MNAKYSLIVQNRKRRILTRNKNISRQYMYVHWTFVYTNIDSAKFQRDICFQHDRYRRKNIHIFFLSYNSYTNSRSLTYMTHTRVR